MSSKKIMTLNSFNKQFLNKLVNTIEELASTSDNVVYVYPVTESNINSINNVLRDQSNPSDDDFSYAYEPAHKYAPQIAEIPTRKVPKLKKSKKWLVRVEGNEAPVKRNFRYKHTALRFAKAMVRKGQARKIEVLN